MIISILGAGAFGSALGKILTDNHHDIRYYDPFLYPEVSLEQATYQANAIIIAIPSANLPEFIENYPESASLAQNADESFWARFR